MKPYRAGWRNPKEYNLGCATNYKLAWEFLRRHSGYALHAEKMLRLVNTGEYLSGIKRNSESLLDGVECWPGANSGETAKQYFARMKSENKQGRIDQPHNTFKNQWSLEVPICPSTEYSEHKVRFVPHSVKLKRHDQLKTKSFKLFLYPNEAAVRFRLDLPIPNQVKIAKAQLTLAARAYAEAIKAVTEEIKRWAVTNANKELPQIVYENAHYWLRCYDAEQEVKVRVTDARRKRAYKSGPSAQMALFNKEKRENKETDFLEEDGITSFLNLARAFIEGKKFLLLLAPQRVTKNKNVDNGKNSALALDIKYKKHSVDADA
jgi:hypothetical protein